MFQQRKHHTWFDVGFGLVVALASTFMACSFDAPIGIETPEGINAILNKAPVRSLSEGDRWTVYEDPGKIRVQHGYGCARVGWAATKDLTISGIMFRLYFRACAGAKSLIPDNVYYIGLRITDRGLPGRV